MIGIGRLFSYLSSMAAQYNFIDQTNQGSNRYASNVMQGEYKSHPVTLFDYHYETYSTDSKGNRNTHHHYRSFFILTMKKSFHELKISRAGNDTLQSRQTCRCPQSNATLPVEE